MIGNVVENAIKYAAGHQVTVETGQRLKAGELWGWMEVVDDDPGIAAELLPHVFERFYRVDASRASSQPADEELAPLDGASVNDASMNGSGLGLAIAQAIAVGHGGDIQVQSSPGQGCRVTIWLPLTWHGTTSLVS
jgi:two-component system OmpR family sensor kinase